MDSWLKPKVSRRTDDSSDGDFAPDVAEESEDDEQGSDDAEESTNLGHSQKMRVIKSQGKSQVCKAKKRQYSPHVPLLPKKRKVMLDSADTRDDETGDDDPDQAGDVDHSSASTLSKNPEYIPRKRTSKHLEEMKTMLADRDEIRHVVPAFPSRPMASWEEFNEVLEKYKRRNNLMFRVRTSQTTALYNSTHDSQIPKQFRWAYKIFRCTHGVSQTSRSKGHRNRKTRFFGCSARFTAFVSPTDDDDFVIEISNENHTHSHPTTASQASSYLTTSTLPLDEQDHEDVKTLADARVSSKHIANFLNERIGCKITPQQTRNLIRDITGKDSAEDRLKDMLHALRQLDGSDVLVLQDQTGVTAGIVMQTKVQKMMFDEWGETLAMDFTHGTNNLGYHLGVLVVTTATGRGFPILDFICQNEQAVTISTILEYFKQKNPGWKHIQSVVIDKDFVEWAVLREMFPRAKILLCQFHAINYWKKVLKRPAFRLKVSQSEELLALMTKMLYSTSRPKYNIYYDALHQYCKDQKRQTFFAYFEKNWDSCRDMWANFARGKVFTAGNTTTNRIESNWNQVKMLLGHKTRIDKTIAGLLQHQMTITQKIAFTIGQQHSTSRVPKTVPKFLRAIACRLSADIFVKVKREWEQFVNFMSGASSKRVAGSVSCWKVYRNNEVFVCDDIDWTCSCIFYSSHHLPCQHIMHLAESCHDFEVLPVITLHDRWSTSVALDMKDDLAAAADLLKPIVQMSKLKSPKAKLPEDEQTDDQTDDHEVTQNAPKRCKEVAYVRLFRKERANQVVLSSSENDSYAKAMLEPLLDHLSCLSSADFYQELAAWKETVDVGLNRSASGRSRRNANEIDVCGGDESDLDSFSVLNPTDAMETVKLMNELEKVMHVTDGSADSGNESDSEDETPPTQRTKLQAMLPPPRPSCGVPQNKNDSVIGNCSEEEVRPEHQGATTPVRAVDIINVPKPKRRGNQRVTTKQLRKTKLNPSQYRLAVHKYPSGLAVTLDQLLVWARNTSNLKFVMEMLERYPVQLEDAYLRARNIECQWEAMRPKDYMHNFVIPVDLTRSFQAAIATARKKQIQPNKLDDSVKRQGFVLDVVATIDPKLWKFSGQFVGALTGFYSVKTKGRMWFEDRKWLEQDWKTVDSNVSLFAVETKTQGLSSDAVCNRHRVLANEVIAKFASSRLRTEFVTLSGKGSITFENILGGLCRGWLNDSHVDFCLRTLAGVTGNCHVLSSLMWSLRWPSIPKIALARINFVLHAVNLDGNHWGIIITRLQMSSAGLRVRVYMYEPLVDECYHDGMRTVWEGIPKDKNIPDSVAKEGLREYLQRWHTASMPEVKLSFCKIEWVLTPQQPDAASCGVLVITQAHNFVAGLVGQQNCNISKNDVKVLRLRMLWVIMHFSKEQAISQTDAAETSAILEQLQKELE